MSAQRTSKPAEDPKLVIGRLVFKVDFDGEIEVSRPCDYDDSDHYDWIKKDDAIRLKAFLERYLT